MSRTEDETKVDGRRFGYVVRFPRGGPYEVVYGTDVNGVPIMSGRPLEWIELQVEKDDDKAREATVVFTSQVKLEDKFVHTGGDCPARTRAFPPATRLDCVFPIPSAAGEECTWVGRMTNATPFVKVTVKTKRLA